MLAALAGGVGASVLDEAAPTLSYTFALGGRTYTVKASAVAALVALGATLAGKKLPGESVLIPLAAGALAFEAGEQLGDDLSDLILGLPSAAPAPLPPGTNVPAAYMYPGGYVDEYTLRQALAGAG
jgi:hypothetical protein